MTGSPEPPKKVAIVTPGASLVLLVISSTNTGLKFGSGKASVVFTLIGEPLNLSIGFSGFPIIVLGIFKLFLPETILSVVSIACLVKNGDNIPSA